MVGPPWDSGPPPVVEADDCCWFSTGKDLKKPLPEHRAGRAIAEWVETQRKAWKAMGG